MAQTVKNLSAMQESQVRSLCQEHPLEKEMATHSIFLTGELHGQRSLVDYTLWGHKESDMTERLTYKYTATTQNILETKAKMLLETEQNRSQASLHR